MDLTTVLRSISDEDFAIVLREATTVEQVLFKICRDGGITLLEDRGVPVGFEWDFEESPALVQFLPDFKPLPTHKGVYTPPVDKKKSVVVQ